MSGELVVLESGALRGAPQREAVLAADAAAARVRDRFPHFLWSWVREQGALDLASWDGVSWWWYTPLSEKSPLRSPIINELYRLALLRELLERASFERVEWHGGDPALAAAAREVATSFGVAFESVGDAPRRPRLPSLALRRGLYLGYALVRHALLRALRLGRVPDAAAPDAVLYTRMPVLWERRGERWRERMFGDWPEYLRSRGHRLVYAASLSAGPGEIVRRRRELAELSRSESVAVLDGLLRLRDLARAHLTGRFLVRYLRWRRAARGRPVVYDGLDIGPLLWRELDACALGTELPLDLSIARGFERLLGTISTPRAVYLPFEYQPMERAVWAGANASARVPLVGLQTGLFTSNQMGFAFPREEMRGDGEPAGAPVPDVIAAYGELPYRVFAARLGEDRVCLSGPVRYAATARSSAGGQAEAVDGVPPDKTVLLVPTPIDPAEALPLLRASFELAARRPELFLLVKFHYHLPLDREVGELARDLGVSRYAVVETDIAALMRTAAMTVCGGSSVGVEALACGSMPLVYRPVGHMSANPMLDVPRAVFFWDTLEELEEAIDACESRDERYRARLEARDEALRELLSPLDGRADERLYAFLEDRGVL